MWPDQPPQARKFKTKKAKLENSYKDNVLPNDYNEVCGANLFEGEEYITGYKYEFEELEENLEY